MRKTYHNIPNRIKPLPSLFSPLPPHPTYSSFLKMKKRSAIYIYLLILLSTPTLHYAQTAPPASQSIPIDGYAAKVNETIITRSDVRSIMAPILPQLYRRYQGAELEQQLDQAYLDAREQLIEQALIIAAFEARGGHIPDYYVNNEIDRIIRDRFNGERARFEEALAAEQVTYEDYLEKTRRNISASMLIRQEINQRARISPETIRITYEANRYDYLIPEKIRYSIILLHHGSTPEEQTLKTETAQHILQKIEAGEDFNALAQEFSEGARADQGGAFPWLQLKDIDPSLHTHLNQLKTGQHSPIIEDDDRLLILKVDARRNAAYQPFSEVRQTIKEHLTNLERERLHQNWMKRLKKEHYVHRYD
jgi:peptidyl-prolyl cis-trans isomerase SurA